MKIKSYKLYLESNENSNLTTKEVFEFFENTIQNFCDEQKEHFKFTINCNRLDKSLNDNEDIKWVVFNIYSEKKFETIDIYPLVKSLYDWSIKNGSNAISIRYDRNYDRIIISTKDNLSISYVICKKVKNPNYAGSSFEVHDLFSYEFTFSFIKN